MSSQKNKQNSTRQLAAILFADIVGYTALMQSNEPVARQNLEKFRNILSEMVSAHNGRIVNNYGDGCLCIFDSSVDAIKCAGNVQLAFQTEPVVPVRIGVHSGDVFFEADNVFGDGVNLASRIESIGIPGSVLFSGKVKDETDNQPDIQSISLGKIEFKNVSQPLEVYALNVPGLKIPSSSDIPKIKNYDASLPWKKKWMIPTFVVLVAIFLLAAWKFGLSGFLGSSTTLSEDEREKRVAVMVFENNTMDPDLDAFGVMISDWLTKGLMETEQADVINAANIKQQVQKSATSEIGSPEFVNSTGVGVLLKGRYYLQDDQLIIRADIVDAEKGNVLYALDQVQNQKDNILDLLEELTQEVLGYWVVKKQTRFLQNPPKYEAYQEWLKGTSLYISDPKQAELLYEQAIELDSNFYAPMFSLFALYIKEGQDSSKNKLLKIIEKSNPQFTKWEQLRYEELMALEDRNWLDAAQLGEKRYLMDLSDYAANSNAFTNYCRANYLTKALEMLLDFDVRYLNQENQEISWRAANESFAQIGMGNYLSVIQLAENYTFPKMSAALAAFHLKSLIRIDSIRQLEQQFQYYHQKGVYNISGRQTPRGQMISTICDELYISGRTDVLKKYVALLMEWASSEKANTDSHRNMGFAHFYLKEYNQALSFWENEKVFESNWPGWLKSSRTIEQTSRLGFCYAALGNVQKTQESIDKILSVETNHPNLKGAQHYYHARILASSGQKEDAIESLSKALELGFDFFRPAVFQMDPFLKSLMDYAPFQELVKPK